ncbi:unnamed protein product, partial [Rotaria magnacalcarata]
ISSGGNPDYFACFLYHYIIVIQPFYYLLHIPKVQTTTVDIISHPDGIE